MHRFLVATLREQARHPLPWVALTLALIAWPLSLLFSPLEATLGSGSTSELLYDVAFLSAIAGALFADRQLEKIGWLLARQPSVALLSVLCLAAGALLPATLSLIPAAFLEEELAGAALPCLPLAALHLGAILHLLALFGFSFPLRSVTLLFFALVLPASIPSDAGLLSFPWRILDPLGGEPLGVANFTMITSQLGSIAVLLLVAVGFRPSLGR